MHERSFRAMGTEVHLVAVPSGISFKASNRSRSGLDEAEHLVHSLDGLWSRFVEGSEISILNASAGLDCTVSRPTFALVQKARIGWSRSGGSFDPTVLGALLDAGYDASFEELSSRSEMPLQSSDLRAGCSSIRLDRRWRSVRLPPKVGFDGGGIAKGLAADLVVTSMMGRRLAGACVNIGGDVSVRGLSPEGGPWIVGIEGSPIPVLLHHGAVATSSTRRRRWIRSGSEAHHIIDPRTGLPSDSGVESLTVVCREGWRAEVASTAAMVAGPESCDSVAARLGARIVELARAGCPA